MITMWSTSQISGLVCTHTQERNRKIKAAIFIIFQLVTVTRYIYLQVGPISANFQMKLCSHISINVLFYFILQLYQNIIKKGFMCVL